MSGALWIKGRVARVETEAGLRQLDFSACRSGGFADHRTKAPGLRGAMQAAGRRAFQEVGRCDDGKRHLMGLQNRVSGARAWRKIGGRGSRGHEDGAGMESGGR